MYFEFLFDFALCHNNFVLVTLLPSPLQRVFLIKPGILYHMKHNLNKYLLGLHTQFSYFPIVLKTWCFAYSVILNINPFAIIFHKKISKHQHYSQYLQVYYCDRKMQGFSIKRLNNLIAVSHFLCIRVESHINL